MAMPDRDTLAETLRAVFAGILKTDPASVDPDKPFDDYGLDSIDAVIGANTLGERLGVELPPEFLLLHRTLNAVLEGLIERESAPEPAAAAPSPAPYLIDLGGV